jgi:hypothetical protein
MGENIKNGKRYIILGYFDSKFKYHLPFLIFSPITGNRRLNLKWREILLIFTEK